MGTVAVELDPAEAGFDPRRLARIDSHFARYVDDGRLAGWQALVARDGRIVHARTYGRRDREADLPVEPDTLWRIYSMTKPVTSVAVMMLCEEGLLALRDPVARWLPPFARILGPLDMVDTGFTIPAAQRDRLAALYVASVPGRPPVRQDDFTPDPREPVEFLSGGAGLVSTAADYHRFTCMLLNRGELDGVRLLGSRTVDYMVRNHLPGGADLDHFGRPIFAETAFEGVGFGLGFSVVVDPVALEAISSAGEYAWGGLGSTAFWVDPVERITAILLTQLVPSDTYLLRQEMRSLVYSALVD